VVVKPRRVPERLYASTIMSAAANPLSLLTLPAMDPPSTSVNDTCAPAAPMERSGEVSNDSAPPSKEVA
jgi:hypothetical protein